MIENKYNVNQKLWIGFKTDASKKIYNDVMDQSLDNQSITTHPKTAKMPDEQWETICHNMACYAAWAIRGDKIEQGDIVEDIKGNKVLKTQVAN